MVKSKKNIRKDEMWCPECGAPIKKRSFICLNCGLKISPAGGKNQKQDSAPGRRSAGSSKRKTKKDDIGSGDIAETMPELIDDLFNTEDSPKSRDGRPGWWNY